MRGRWKGKTLVSAIVDLPFAVSPVVVGLALVLVYGNKGWIGSTFAEHGIRIIFSTPGMVLATIFVSLPFVVREVVPVLREIGTEQEEAAPHARLVGLADVLAHHAAGDPLGRRVRRRSSRPPARSASSARSRSCRARSRARPRRMTLFVEQRFQAFDLTGAYAASVVLALLAIAVIGSMTLLDRRKEG